MKKNIFCIASIILITLGIVSCKKSDSINYEQLLQNKWLIDSIATYSGMARIGATSYSSGSYWNFKADTIYRYVNSHYDTLKYTLSNNNLIIAKAITNGVVSATKDTSVLYNVNAAYLMITHSNSTVTNGASVYYYHR